MVSDASSPPVDIENLRAWFQDSLNEALGLFLGGARTVASALPAAVTGRDAKTVWSLSHKLVGSARMAGASALVAACDALCHATDGEDWPAAEAATGRVSAEVARIEAWVDSRRQGETVDGKSQPATRTSSCTSPSDRAAVADA